MDAFSAKTILFKTALFASTKLVVGLHTLTINCTGQWFDIDAIIVVSGDGKVKFVSLRIYLNKGFSANCISILSTGKNTTTLDDSDSSITYLPSLSSWPTDATYITDYYHNTAQYVFLSFPFFPYFGIMIFFQSISRTVNTSLEASFTGNALELYGSTRANHGLFSVQIDDGNITILNASSTQYHKPSVPLVSTAFAKDVSANNTHIYLYP